MRWLRRFLTDEGTGMFVLSILVAVTMLLLITDGAWGQKMARRAEVVARETPETRVERAVREFNAWRPSPTLCPYGAARVNPHSDFWLCLSEQTVQFLAEECYRGSEELCGEALEDHLRHPDVRTEEEEECRL